MRAPSLFSPAKQKRYEAQNGGFQAFQSTSQLRKHELADFRKEVRTQAQTREPFVKPQEKSTLVFASWKKDFKNNDYGKYQPKSSPKKSKIPGGLNIDEIFGHRKTQEAQPGYYLPSKVETIFKKSPTNLTYNNSLGTGNRRASYKAKENPFHESPAKSQQKLDRFKSWDSILDVQLKLQNSQIKKKLTPPKANLSSLLKEESKDFQSYKTNLKLFNNTPPKQKYQEKYSLTDIVRMGAHFNQLSSQDIITISKREQLNNQAYIDLEYFYFFINTIYKQICFVFIFKCQQ
ncbi:hypothetical protein pb186bvf_005431 [Paramecium bursaria]